MPSSRYFALLCVLLGVFCGSAYAESTGGLDDSAAALAPRQRRCLNPGWIIACPGPRPCVPPGGICCSGSTYVMPPRTCPDGSVPITTAPGSDSTITSTIALPSASAPPPVVEYRWYTYTITYYYYYYYYTYFAEFSYGLTSSRTVYLTTVSLTATDEVEASSSLNAISATLSNAIPSQTATTTLGSAPTASPTPIQLPTPSVTGTISIPTGNGTVPTGPPAQFTGAAIGLHAGMSSSFCAIFSFIASALVAIPSLLMVWL